MIVSNRSYFIAYWLFDLSEKSFKEHIQYLLDDLNINVVDDIIRMTAGYNLTENSHKKEQHITSSHNCKLVLVFLLEATKLAAITI